MSESPSPLTSYEMKALSGVSRVRNIEKRLQINVSFTESLLVLTARPLFGCAGRRHGVRSRDKENG
jgi:hypothetical protein